MNSQSETTSHASFKDQSALSQLSQSKRIYKRKNKERVKRWTDEECHLYRLFIRNNIEIMNDPVHKRTTKIFLLMSDFIETKTPSQCRSHHQKFFSKINLETCDLDSSSWRETAEGTYEVSLNRTNSYNDLEFQWDEGNSFNNAYEDLFEDSFEEKLQKENYYAEYVWSEYGLVSKTTDFFADDDNKSNLLF